MSTVLTGPQRNTCDSRGILRRLGIIGFDALEPIILAALATETPLLIIGKHGTAKSLLLCRLCEALGISWRHYNASLVNYDDLVGYPLPNAAGKLEFVQTPASIWDAEAVFIDEISRARPDMQNRLFPIVHERKVQGIPLDKLRFRWCAMNPPAIESDITENYIGSEPLDPALADRFGFIVEAPDWGTLTDRDREAVITSEFQKVQKAIKSDLKKQIERIRSEMTLVEEVFKSAFAAYTREMVDKARSLNIPLSGRRSAMIFRNLLAVHATRVTQSPSADPSDSLWIGVSASLPQRVSGTKLDTARLLVAHNSVWKTLSLEAKDPRRVLALERDPVRRALRAVTYPNLEKHELSAYVADAFAELPPGGRHALAHHIVESGYCGRLIAAVADQAAELYLLTSVRCEIDTRANHNSTRLSKWNEVVTAIAKLDPDDGESILLGNLLAGLWRKDSIGSIPDVCESWKKTRELCAAIREAAHV